MDFSGYQLLLTIVYSIYRMIVAWIQRDQNKVVELHLSPDGGKQLIIKGYSQEEQAKIVRQVSRESVANSPKVLQSNGTTTLSKVLKR